MVKTTELKNDYHLTVSPDGGEVNMTLKTGYPETTNFEDYIIRKNDDLVETLSVYETGLVVYWKQTSKEIEILSNKEFQLEDDGNFWLVSE